MQQEFIVHDFKLPNHSNELNKANEIIEKTRKKYKILENRNTIVNSDYFALFNETIRVLDYIGRLSMPAFAIEDEIERLYTLKFKQFPELAKKLWLDHYQNIHHPYNLLKNRCFKQLEDLNKLYFKVNKKRPPNYD